MKRVYAMRRIGTAKMRYEEATSPGIAAAIAMTKETKETGMSGRWQVFKTSFTPKHWEKEKNTYMNIYVKTAQKMFEEESL